MSNAGQKGAKQASPIGGGGYYPLPLRASDPPPPRWRRAKQAAIFSGFSGLIMIKN